MMSQVHVVGSPEAAFFVNAFVIEGQRSVVVIDTHFLRSSAAVLRRRVDEIGKPIAAILITHPHPDHFNGTAIVAAGSTVPVLATAATRRVIEETAELKVKTWKPTYGDDYPDSVIFPDTVIQSGDVLTFDDIELVHHELGPGESADAGVVHLPNANALIASDLIYSSCHPWLAEGRSAEWLAHLDEIERRFSGVERMYAGHGPTGGLELIEAQRDYISFVRRLIDAEVQAGHSLDEARAQVKQQVLVAYPDLPLAMLVDLNTEGLWGEIAR